VADVQPFLGYLVRPEHASEVAALPYDVFSRDEAALEIAAHPQSFLRIDKPCALLPELDEYDPRVYELAAELLAADIQAGVYTLEETPHYYLYALEQEGHRQIGLLATVATDDYRSGLVRRHENTRAKKRRDRIAHIKALEAQTGPVLLAYRPQPSLDSLMARYAEGAEPLFDFVAPDGVRHTIWRVEKETSEKAFAEALETIEPLYIADGHHRAAAAAETGGAYFLAILFSAGQLRILDYNRVIASLNGLEPRELLCRIEEDFELEPAGTHALRPTQRGEFSLYLSGAWYRLRIREGRRAHDAVAGLDVSLLHDRLLAPLLGITDPRQDPRISYVGGGRGLGELQRRVDARGDGAAWALFPCSFEELCAVADEGRLMPPKSTWFEPKPRSGLFIHPLSLAEDGRLSRQTPAQGTPGTQGTQGTPAPAQAPAQSLPRPSTTQGTRDGL
jgi:uncharacterized protein (DUF1015 family)